MRVLLIGGSGLVGRALIGMSCDRSDLHLDLLLRRSPPQLPEAAEVFVAERLSGALAAWQTTAPRCDVFISALGTTRRAAGSIEAFARIDRDLVLDVARAARVSGARQAILVSSVGADPRSRNAYLRIKGELEQGVAALGYARCDFLHPGLLLGAREQTGTRRAERIGQWLAPWLNPLLLGPLASYRGIAAQTVGAAAAALVDAQPPGLHRHRFRALAALAREAAVVSGRSPG